MPQLDSLRAFAVLLVIAAHTSATWQFPWGLQHLPLGDLGVQLFFVLSGFLITRILLECRQVVESGAAGWWLPVRHFYIRRFLRIFPLYYAVLALCIVRGIPDAREHWPSLVSYTVNISQAQTGKFLLYFGHFWSLAVEEQFYIIWPWIVVFCPKKWLPATILAMIAIGPAWRAVSAGVGANRIAAFCETPACLDSLAAGSLLALFSMSRPKWDKAEATLRRGLPVTLGTFLIVTLQLMRGHMGGYDVLMRTIAAFVFVTLISTAARGFTGIAGRILSAAPLRYIGKVSYGVYVFHPFATAAVVRTVERTGHHIPWTGGITFVAVTAATIGIASLSWWFYEKPLNDLKRHFPYKPRQVAIPRFGAN